MTPLRQRLTSRKFLGSVVLFVTALILLATGTIDQGTWSTIVLTVYGIYSGSNIADKSLRRLSGSSLASSGRSPQSER